MKAGNRTNISQLQAMAKTIRMDVIRMVARHGQGYIQQGLGAADLFTQLYFQELRFDSDNPNWQDRDRFIMSTAHNTAVFYSTLARAGLIDLEMLEDYCLDGSALEINASERLAPLVECTCGSLGQGLSVAAGLAMGAKLQKRNSNIYLMLGDGELEEGQVWEAAMFASKYKLYNLTAIVDRNNIQIIMNFWSFCRTVLSEIHSTIESHFKAAHIPLNKNTALHTMHFTTVTSFSSQANSIRHVIQREIFV